jgi:glycosyltransferase involved in cell wall biosynthesis
MKIFIILPRVPYPMIDGASKANFQFVHGLSSCGFSVTAFCIGTNKEKSHLLEFKNQARLDDVKFFERYNTDKYKKIKLLLNFLRSPFKPVTYFSFFDKKLSNVIREELEFKKYDFIIGITPHCIVPLLKNKFSYIYRSENVEYELWEQSKKTTNNPFKRIFFKLQENLVKNLETKIIKKSQLTFTISGEDKLQYIKLSPHSWIESIPMSFHFSPPLPFTLKSKLNLFYLGKLDWPPNFDGLVWFLENVWKHLNKETHDRVELTIAGSGNSEKIESFINKMPINLNIKFLGRIDDVKKHYERCDLVIAPIFYGSGTRIKILEAALYGRACISTKIGFQGSPVRLDGNYPGGLLAHSDEEWINLIDNLDTSSLKDFGQNAHDQCKEHIDFDSTSIKVKNFILKLRPELDGHHQ